MRVFLRLPTRLGSVCTGPMTAVLIAAAVIVAGAISVACRSNSPASTSAGSASESASVSAPRSLPRYVVTAAPLDIGIHPKGMCVGFDPATSQDVWWWEPGQAGCANRSSSIMPAQQAAIVADKASATSEVRFRLPLIVAPGSKRPNFVDVRLRIEDGHIVSTTTGARVPVARRQALDIAENYRTAS